MPNTSYSDFVFDKYCTLRNYIRKANLINSLYAVWAHVNYLQFKNFNLPPELINIPSEYRNNKKKETFIKYGVYEWEMEVIVRELLIHSTAYENRKNFCNWNDLASAMNKLKSLEDDIGGHFINESNVLLEFKRISHRQFPWQTIPNTQKLIRYWQIFSRMDSYFLEVYGIPFTHFYVISYVLFGIFSSKFMIDYPPTIDLGPIDQSTLDTVLSFISLDYSTISSRLRSELSMYHDYVYKFHSLTAFPLVKIDVQNRQKLICPLPTFLFNRITDGIYYDLINDRNNNSDEIKNKIGEVFQNYIGDFIQRSTGDDIQIFSEERYGSSHHRRDTVDWFLMDRNSDAILIECKAKRLTISAKSELDDEGALDRDLRILAKAVKQGYKSLIDYQNGDYPSTFPSSRNQYLMISTLEEWYVFGNVINEKLELFVKEELLQAAIDVNILDSVPYFIASASTVERLSNILRTETIEEVLTEFFRDSEKKSWHIDTYISNKYTNNEYINPFNNEFHDFIENQLIAVCRS